MSEASVQQKKIIYIANAALPTGWAHGYQIMKTCEALADAGHEVHLVVTNRPDPGMGKRDPFETYGVRRVFQLAQLPVTDVFATSPGFLGAMGFRLRRWTFIRSVKKFLSSLKSPDVVYVRDAYLANRLKSATAAPIIFEMHSLLDARGWKRIRRVSGVACLTRALQRRVSEQMPNCPTAVIPDSVDLSVFDTALTREQARAQLKISAKDRVIMYVGRLATMGSAKGAGMLDHVVHRLAQSDSRIKLFLVGGSSDEFTQIEGRSPSPSTTCVAYVPRDVVAAYERAADVLVMPFPRTSHYAEAMSPMKMFEYMASKTPIVTSDLPSVRDVLDEQTAFFYHADDDHDLERVLSDVLAQPKAERDRIGQAAYQRVAERYTWKQRALDITHFFTQL